MLDVDLLVKVGLKGFCVSLHHSLKHFSGGDAGQSDPRPRKRENQFNEVVRGIADHGLVKVTNLNFDLTRRVGHWTQFPM